jgi:hypothetical protein
MKELYLEKDYPEYLQLETSNFRCILTCSIMIKNILDKKVELIDQWGMLNVISRTDWNKELLHRLDEKIDEEICEVEKEMEWFQYWNKSGLEWEIADVLEVTQAIKYISRNLTTASRDEEEILCAAINTRKYIVGIIKEYNLQIRDIIKVKKDKYKKKGWFKEWFIWWAVSHEELETEEWIDKLVKLLRY